MEAGQEINSTNIINNVKDGNTEKKEVSETKGDDQDVQMGNTVAKHYNELKECGLASRGQSRIFYLRNFNNWIKSVLIGNTLQKFHNENSRGRKIAVLDMCSGKGGDILKWNKGRIDKLVCVDIAETSVEQSKKRYKDLQDRFQDKQPIFNAEFLTADVTKQRLKGMYSDPALQFDIVSCQFALHYSFESYPQADMMLRNTSECLKPGGYFIGTTLDSNELVHRLRSTEGNNFGNEVYNVQFESPDKDNIPLFGAQYRFCLEGVVDCPEFLVYFPAFVKLAQKHNLRLLFKKPFAEYFDENIKAADENRGLLGRMHALESYPADNGQMLISNNNEDYSFAKEALRKAKTMLIYQNSRRPLKVGTLSKAEWEAITLYLVFVMQKVNPDDDDDKSESNTNS